jgi:hypothetical protein
MATMDHAKCEEGFWGQKALEYNRDRNNICGTANGDWKFKAYEFEQVYWTGAFRSRHVECCVIIGLVLKRLI